MSTPHTWFQWGKMLGIDDRDNVDDGYLDLTHERIPKWLERAAQRWPRGPASFARGYRQEFERKRRTK